MAIAFANWKMVMKWVDSGGQNTTTTVDLIADDAAAITAIEGAATAIAAAYNGASDGVLLGYDLTKQFVENALTLPATAQREMKAVINANLDGKPLDVGRIVIPMPNNGIFVAATGANNNIVDSGDAAVQAVLALYQTTAGVATLSDGDTVDDTTPFRSGYRRHYASGKSRATTLG